MSQNSDSGSESPLLKSPMAASVLSGFVDDQPFPLEFVAAEELVQIGAALYTYQAKEYEENDEAVLFSTMLPGKDDVDVESQFTDSTPQDASIVLLTQLTSLCDFRDFLKKYITENSEVFFKDLQEYMKDIQVYGNQSIVATLGRNMLVPMLSFYGIATKDVITSQIKPNIGAIRNKLVEMTKSQFTTPVESAKDEFTHAEEFPDTDVDCVMPTASNMVWNVRLKLHGNIFTLLTFRIVAMKPLVFEPQNPGVVLTLQNYLLHLLFALLSKACTGKFNCLCAMPDIDVALFETILTNDGALHALAVWMHSFLVNLDDPQLISKRRYMKTALHNLVANYLDKKRIEDGGIQAETGETLAYKKLFDGDTPGSGANTFNPIMQLLSKLIQISRPLVPGLQVSLCGGRMVYMSSEVLRDYIETTFGKTPEALLEGIKKFELPLNEMVKPLNLPSDLDFTFSFEGLTHEDPNNVQPRLMFLTLCAQLGIKKIIDNFCSSSSNTAYFTDHVVVGISMVGGGEFQLSSARNSCYALSFLDAINVTHGQPPLTAFLANFRDIEPPTESSLAPCDDVPKMNSGNYIMKIFIHVFNSGYVDKSETGFIIRQIQPYIEKIAKGISKYSMSTDEGFSSVVKVFFDIIFTLFSIENFTNRAFVTQKINKELKRIAICASILFFHFNELLTTVYVDTSSEQYKQITTMIKILRKVIEYGYDPAIKLISKKIHHIMQFYAACFCQLLHLYKLDVVFYSRVPLRETFPRPLTSLEGKCMKMLRVEGHSNHEELSDDLLTSIVSTGITFLRNIETNGGILANFIQLKQEIKSLDLDYKSKGEFLTSIQAVDVFLDGLTPMLLAPSTLLPYLAPLLVEFSNGEFALIMQFRDVVVVQSEFFTDAAKAKPNIPQGLIVTGNHQVGVFALLSMFCPKFKSDPDKIALFTTMLFRSLFSRGATDACMILLGLTVEQLGFIDGARYINSFENNVKDVTLIQVLSANDIVLERLPSIGIYYGAGEIHYGFNAYVNPLYGNVYPFMGQFDGILYFRFLNLQILKHLVDFNTVEFNNLQKKDALQPRAYELLIGRLLGKFSILTKDYDEIYKKSIPADTIAAHGGRNLKHIRQKIKMLEIDIKFTQESIAFFDTPLSPADLDRYILGYFLAISREDSSMFTASDKDASKFYNTSQKIAENVETYRQYLQPWSDHLLEMLIFFKYLSITHPDLRDFCIKNIIKYSKLTFFLKDFLPPPTAAAAAAFPAASALAPHAAAAAAPPTFSFTNKGNEVSKPVVVGTPPVGRRGVVKPPTPKSVKGKPNDPSSAKGGGTIRTRNPRSPKKTNNHTRKNKYKRNNKNKKHKSSPKYRKVIPSSRSGSQSNRKKSKSKLPHKNVTFKRRRARK